MADILGLKPGQSIPMERDGQPGELYRPVIHLTADEYRLLAAVFDVADRLPAIEDTRDEFVRLLHQAANETITESSARALMVEHVLAYQDEIAMLHASGPH